MASTYSALKIQLMATGENSGTWGNVTNVNLGTALEEAIVGSADVTFTSANVTLSLTDSNASQTARNLRLNLVGTTGGARDLIVPAIEKVYIVNNGCADTVTIKNSSGTGISVPPGKTEYVYNNGTNVVEAINHLTSLTLDTALPIASGGTGSNSATFSGANITALNASAVSSGTLDNARTTAASANGASTIIARDASGNFTANTATLTTVTGNGSGLTSLNASSLATGTVPTARLGSGTADNTTFLRGDQTFATISSSPPALSSTFPLKSATSLAAGRVVNINSVGEVGDYPAVNSIGSVVTNSGGNGNYTQFSTNGSRALNLDAVDPPFPNGGNTTLTIKGMAVTGSGFTNGTVNVTSNINVRSGGGGLTNYSYSTIPINATQFLVNFWMQGYGFVGECGVQRLRVKAFVVTVDSSGNCTKGSELTYFSIDGLSGQSAAIGMYRFVSGLYGVYINYVNLSNVAVPLGYYLTVAGDTVTSTQDNDFYNYTGSTKAGGAFGQITSSNIAVNTGSGDNSTFLYKATWNGSALGAVTNENLFPLGGRVASRLVSPTLLVAVNSDTSNVVRIFTFTINQSTGAATQFASRILDNTFVTTPIYLELASESSTRFVLSLYNASKVYGYSFEINSSGDILGTGIKLTTELTNDNMNPTYTGSSSTYRFADFSTKTQNFVVSSYNTPQWNSLGVSQTAQNTSPATIITDGVASGFAGLTPGVTYYIDQTTYNGAVTATPGNFVVGLATSSTQISLGL
jgi:hypothetical protein